VIVVDTNIITYLILPSPLNEQADKLFAKDPNWQVPILWRAEFCSVLRKYLNNFESDKKYANEVLKKALSFFKYKEYLVSVEKVLDLSLKSNCSIYDCEFVALAQELNIPLVTGDKKIAKAFPKMTILINSKF